MWQTTGSPPTAMSILSAKFSLILSTQRLRLRLAPSGEKSTNGSIYSEVASHGHENRHTLFFPRLGITLVLNSHEKHQRRSPPLGSGTHLYRPLVAACLFYQ